MKDVPLEKAMVYWTSAQWEGCRDVVKIVEHPDTGHQLPLASSDGACWCFWPEMTNEDRLNYLFAIFIDLSVREAIPARMIAEAFEAIPEFRHMLARADKRKNILFEGV